MVASQRDISGQADSSRNIVIIVAIIAAVLIAGVFYLLMRAGRGAASGGQTRLEGAIRAGSPEWEKDSKKIVLEEPWADEGGRIIGDTVMTLHTNIHNFTGKTLSGLEVWAAVVDHDGKPVRQRYIIVVPARQPELEANKIMALNVVLDGMVETDDRANIKMEVTGFKYK
jgi:hypothetical protein